MVTLTPTAPLVGEKLVIVEGAPTVKLVALVAVPENVVTLIGPVVAPDGTLAVICVSETVVSAAEVPLKVRDEAVGEVLSRDRDASCRRRRRLGVKLVIVGGGGITTIVSRVAALFAPLGSDPLDATVAVLVIVPADPGVTTIVAVATRGGRQRAEVAPHLAEGRAQDRAGALAGGGGVHAEDFHRYPVKEPHAHCGIGSVVRHGERVGQGKPGGRGVRRSRFAEREVRGGGRVVDLDHEGVVVARPGSVEWIQGGGEVVREALAGHEDIAGGVDEDPDAVVGAAAPEIGREVERGPRRDSPSSRRRPRSRCRSPCRRPAGTHWRWESPSNRSSPVMCALPEPSTAMPWPSSSRAAPEIGRVDERRGAGGGRIQLAT